MYGDKSRVLSLVAHDGGLLEYASIELKNDKQSSVGSGHARWCSIAIC